MRAKIYFAGIGAGIPKTEYCVNVLGGALILFHMGDKPKLGDMWYAYSMTDNPSIGERGQSIIGSAVTTDWFHVKDPSIYSYIGSLTGCVGKIEVSSPLLISRKCEVQMTVFDKSNLKKFDFHVNDVRCKGIQLGGTVVKGTLIPNLDKTHPKIAEQIRTGMVGM